MHAQRLVAALAITSVFAGGALAAGCRSEKATPAAEVETSTPEAAANQPLTIEGCLRAGDAADTFVLTATASSQAASPATYPLVGVDEVSLKDHIGQRVEVKGVVHAQQHMASQSGPQPADTPRGTTGGATVETRTDLDVKHLDVSQVRPVGGQCEELK